MLRLRARLIRIENRCLVAHSVAALAIEGMVASRLRPAPSLRRAGADQFDVEKMPGAVILSGQFTAVQQAVGTAKANVAAAAWLRAFVEEAKASGLMARFNKQFKVQGLSVAPQG